MKIKRLKELDSSHQGFPLKLRRNWDDYPDAVTREMERLRVLEQGERNAVEGKIGTAKAR